MDAAGLLSNKRTRVEGCVLSACWCLSHLRGSTSPERSLDHPIHPRPPPLFSTQDATARLESACALAHPRHKQRTSNKFCHGNAVGVSVPYDIITYVLGSCLVKDLAHLVEHGVHLESAVRFAVGIEKRTEKKEDKSEEQRQRHDLES